MYTSYGQLSAEVYDFTKPIGYSTGDVEYYSDRLKYTKGLILELGCGTGRILIPLLQDGLNVHGLDNAEAMLELCRVKCEALGLSSQLYLAEMPTFQQFLTYDAIIIPGGSLQLIEGKPVVQQTLDQIYNNLAKDGRLLLDLFVPTNRDTSFKSTKQFKLNEHETIILDEERIEMDIELQKMVSRLTYTKLINNEIVQTEVQRLALSWYDIKTFKHMLLKSGFRSVSVSADYEYLKQPELEGQMITFEATK